MYDIQLDSFLWLLTVIAMELAIFNKPILNSCKGNQMAVDRYIAYFGILNGYICSMNKAEGFGALEFICDRRRIPDPAHNGNIFRGSITALVIA